MSTGESCASWVRRYVASVGGTGDPATAGAPAAFVTKAATGGGAPGADGIWILRPRFGIDGARTTSGGAPAAAQAALPGAGNRSRLARDGPGASPEVLRDGCECALACQLVVRVRAIARLPPARRTTLTNARVRTSCWHAVRVYTAPHIGLNCSCGRLARILARPPNHPSHFCVCHHLRRRLSRLGALALAHERVEAVLDGVVGATAHKPRKLRPAVSQPGVRLEQRGVLLRRP